MGRVRPTVQWDRTPRSGWDPTEISRFALHPLDPNRELAVESAGFRRFQLQRADFDSIIQIRFRLLFVDEALSAMRPRRSTNQPIPCCGGFFRRAVMVLVTLLVGGVASELQAGCARLGQQEEVFLRHMHQRGHGVVLLDILAVADSGQAWSVRYAPEPPCRGAHCRESKNLPVPEMMPPNQSGPRKSLGHAASLQDSFPAGFPDEAWSIPADLGSPTRRVSIDVPPPRG
jgi:hypothetical protein